ncbi:MAG: VIT domain-containing protein [Syntrophobacteraceae bacterium]
MKNSPFLFEKTLPYCLIAVLILLVSVPAPPAYGQETESADKTLSPYFYVNSDDPSVDELPLKSTTATANISGIIANVSVTQIYKNEGKKTLEAIYVFPASTRAAVHGMKMTVGERTITAKIEKREEARQAYEEARKQGRSASLLEQQRPNVFQMNVANIMPGDEIKTELHYTELLIPTEGIYEFAYPTVVGPRYSNVAESKAAPSEKWSKNPYLHEGEAPPFPFDIKVNIAAGMDIQDISSPSHRLKIAYEGRDLARVSLDSSEKSAGNRDFLLAYRLAGTRIESGLLLFEGPDENYFLLNIEPPERLSLDAIPSREYIFIVDVSGSMHGYPLEITKKLFKNLAAGLRQKDSFNILLFSGGSRLMSERSLPANPENVGRAVDLISKQQGGGGTELLPALRRALTLPRAEGVSRTIVIVTDGYVTVEPEAFDLMRELIGNANFFPFGIGTSVNRHLIEGMARIGKGEPFVITKPDEAPAMAEKFRRYIQYPLLTQIGMDFGSFEAYDVEPAGIPDLFASRPVTIHGKWRGKPRGVITLSGISGETKYEKKLDVSQAKPLTDNSALRYLWARARIAQLCDYNNLHATDSRTRETTELGLKYSLLTPFTSFVAIDSPARSQGRESTTVKQPLPLPSGVSDYAVGDPGAGLAMAVPSPVPMYSPGYSGPPRARRGTKALGDFARKPAGAVSTGGFTGHEELAETGPGDLPKISLSSLSVQGALSENVVRQYIEQDLEKLRTCIDKIGMKSAGKILTLSLTIGADGLVMNVRGVWSEGGDVGLECIYEKIGKWTFPAPGTRGEVRALATISITGP